MDGSSPRNCSTCSKPRFGLMPFKTVLDDLHCKSLPCPGLALLWDDAMNANFTILDQRFKMAPGQNKRYLSIESTLRNVDGFIFVQFFQHFGWPQLV